MNSDRDELRRRKAFEHYFDLGTKRSVNKLYYKYAAMAQENPEAVADIPTRDRNQLYNWAKEDNWDLKAKERELAQIESAQKRVEAARERAYDKLSLMGDAALDRLFEITKSTEEKLALQASVEILDRLGIAKLDKRVAQPSTTPRQTSAPGEDASDEEIRQWLASRVTQKG